MKKILAVFLILILLVIFIVYRNTNPKIIISNLAPQEGIQAGGLKYRIYLFGFLPAGEAVFNKEALEEYKGQKVYHLNARAESLKVFAKLFHAEAILDSYIDTVKFNPLLFRQKIKLSNKPDVIKEASYDQKNNIMDIAGVKRQILPDTQDPLSLLFNLKKMDLEPVNGIEMSINTNQKNYIFKGACRGEDITINKKPYKLFLVNADIARRDKNPYHKSNIKIVFLKNDAKNTPVLIKVFASGFFMSIKLVSIK